MTGLHPVRVSLLALTLAQHHAHASLFRLMTVSLGLLMLLFGQDILLGLNQAYIFPLLKLVVFNINILTGSIYQVKKLSHLNAVRVKFQRELPTKFSIVFFT